MILNRASLANDTDQSEHIRPGRLSCSWKASWEHVPREERGLPGHRGPRPAPWGRWTLPRTTTSRNRRSSGLRGPDKQKQREAAYRGASSSKLPGNSQTRRGEPADLSRPQNPQLPILYHPPKHSHSCPNQAQRIPDCQDSDFKRCTYKPNKCMWGPRPGGGRPGRLPGREKRSFGGWVSFSGGKGSTLGFAGQEISQHPDP